MVAVGGYARSWLFPGSDVDLLFVHGRGFEREAEALASSVLYPLWDAGLRLSHAVRTPKDCVREAERDLKSLTTVLGARLLAGPEDLFREAREGIVRIVRDEPLRFVDELRRSRVERGERFGILHHQQEPDLKEALGGIRDVHIAWWLADGLGGGADRGLDLTAHLAVLSVEPSSMLAARALLHGVTASPSDRLLAEAQPVVAEALGVRAVHGWTPEDRLLRLVLREARAIEVRVESVLEDIAGRLGSSRARPCVSVDPTKAPPARLLEGFARMAEQGGVAAPSDLMTSSAEEVVQPPAAEGARSPAEEPARPRARWSLDAVDAFLRVLSAGERGGRVLEIMDAMGQLARFVPEWEHVAGRAQRDPYHRFPVDVHLLATAAEAARLLREADEPFAAEAVRSVDDPDALVLGALLHDIGKVGTGSHVPTGVEVADRVVSRIGVAEGTREQMLFLVREHLLLSDTATRRNLEDEDLILHVAARIRDERRLAMLYLLTVADAVATGPSASTPWRMALVRDLVAKVSHVLARGSMDRAQAERLEEIEAMVRRELKEVPVAEVDAFLDDVPTTYLLSVEPFEVSQHFRLVLPEPAANEVRTSVRPGRARGTYLSTVAASDRIGLLASVAGAMTLSGLSILTAQVFTTGKGVALDLFEVRGAFEQEISDERWGRFERLLGETLAGRLDLGEEVEALRSHYLPPKTGIKVSVSAHQDASDFSTLVEVEGPDRLGLLFDLTSALAKHGFDVHSAKVATYGPRVVDVFYVTDADGQKVVQAEREAELERVLGEAVSGR